MKSKQIKKLMEEIKKEMQVSKFEVERCKKNILELINIDNTATSAYSLANCAEEMKWNSAQYLAYNKILCLMEMIK
jgi:hypothetical protein